MRCPKGYGWCILACVVKKDHIKAAIEEISAANLLEKVKTPVKRSYLERLRHKDRPAEPEEVIPAESIDPEPAIVPVPAPMPVTEDTPEMETDREPVTEPIVIPVMNITEPITEPQTILLPEPVPAAAPAVQPAVTEEVYETIADAEAPAAAPVNDEAAGKPTEVVELAEEVVPLVRPVKFWALLNLICAAVTAVFGLGMLVSFLRKPKEDEKEEPVEEVEITEEDEEEEEKKRRKSKLMGLIPALGSIILFILTEDMKNPMRLTDKWTIWMVVLALVNVVLAYLTRNQKMGRLVFDANGGNGTMTSIVGEMGKDVRITSNAFTNDGYTFAGWNTKADGTGESYGDGDSWKMSEDKPNKLFAQWKH